MSAIVETARPVRRRGRPRLSADEVLARLTRGTVIYASSSTARVPGLAGVTPCKCGFRVVGVSPGGSVWVVPIEIGARAAQSEADYAALCATFDRIHPQQPGCCGAAGLLPAVERVS